MNLVQAGALERRIRKLSEGHGYMPQQSRPWASEPLDMPLAFVPRRWWRQWWALSQDALLAEGSTWFSTILWDEPARPVVLHYAREAAA